MKAEDFCARVKKQFAVGLAILKAELEEIDKREAIEFEEIDQWSATFTTENK